MACALYIVYYINGLVQERRNSMANALELCLSCSNPLLLPRLGAAFDLRLAVSVPLPIVMGIFVLLWFQSRLT